MFGEIEQRSGPKPGLFLPVDGCGGSRKRASAAAANLNENEAILVQHDQINFTETRAKIAFEAAEAAVAQKLQSAIFSGFSYSSRF